MQNILVVDNLISLKAQDTIEEMLFVDNFPWYFIKDVTQSEKNGNPAFFHLFIDKMRTNSSFSDYLLPIVNSAKEKINFSHDVIYHARTFLQLSLNPNVLKTKIDFLHVDANIPHMVVLYYVCNSDGDTIIVNKKYNGTVEEKTLLVEDFEQLAKITPKKGRAIIFDGAYYHTAEQPIKSKKRCVININLISKE
jgi:hypothetical protein